MLETIQLARAGDSFRDITANELEDASRGAQAFGMSANLQYTISAGRCWNSWKAFLSENLV